MDNFFEVEDDYLLVASINRIKPSSEFLIFDSMGKIVGMSEQLHSTMFPQIDIRNLLDNTFIFLVMPQIFEVF